MLIPDQWWLMMIAELTTTTTFDATKQLLSPSRLLEASISLARQRLQMTSAAAREGGKAEAEVPIMHAGAMSRVLIASDDARRNGGGQAHARLLNAKPERTQTDKSEGEGGESRPSFTVTVINRRRYGQACPQVNVREGSQTNKTNQGEMARSNNVLAAQRD